MIDFHNINSLSFMEKCHIYQYDLAIVDAPTESIPEQGAEFPKSNYSVPGEMFFAELFRVSKNQIICGANKFLNYLPNTECMLVYKVGSAGKSFSKVDIAWTSFDIECFEIKEPKFKEDEIIIHPFQRPVYFYNACFAFWSDYIKKSIKDLYVLDTHGGSCSSAIAGFENSLNMDICEINKSYYKDGKTRFYNKTAQQMLPF